jgi:hypothetical protein
MLTYRYRFESIVSFLQNNFLIINYQLIFYLSISLMSSGTDLLRNKAIQNQRNFFLRGFPLLFNRETLQASGALFQIPHYRKCLYCKTKMLCTHLS